MNNMDLMDVFKISFLVFGRPYYRSSLWYSVSSVVCLSVTFCIVAKRYVLAKKCLKEWIGNQDQKVHFLGCCHISTSDISTEFFDSRCSFLCFMYHWKLYMLVNNLVSIVNNICCINSNLQKAGFWGGKVVVGNAWDETTHGLSKHLCC